MLPPKQQVFIISLVYIEGSISYKGEGIKANILKQTCIKARKIKLLLHKFEIDKK